MSDVPVPAANDVHTSGDIPGTTAEYANRLIGEFDEMTEDVPPVPDSFAISQQKDRASANASANAPASGEEVVELEQVNEGDTPLPDSFALSQHEDQAFAKAPHISKEVVELEQVNEDNTPLPDSFAISQHEDQDTAKEPDSNEEHPSNEASNERIQQKANSSDNRTRDSFGNQGLDAPTTAAATTRQPNQRIQRFLQLPTRPATSRSDPNETGPDAAGRRDNGPAEPSVPILEATLVEDQPTGPVYDAVPIENDGENERSWQRRKRKYAIVVAGLVAIIGALVAIIGVQFSPRNDGDPPSALGEELGQGPGATPTPTNVLGIASPTFDPNLSARTGSPSLHPVKPTATSPPFTLPSFTPPSVTSFPTKAVRTPTPTLTDSPVHAALAAAAAMAQERQKVCRDLTDLQSHMSQSFEKLMGKTFTTSYECTCGELGEDGVSSFAIECLLEYGDGGKSFINSEKMTFEQGPQGEYRLSQTSWSDSSIGSIDIPQEVFGFQEGVLRSCTVNGCVSCAVCDDGGSVTIDCGAGPWNTGYDPSRECGEGYTGAFANTFDFGVPGLTSSSPSTSLPTKTYQISNPPVPEATPSESLSALQSLATNFGDAAEGALAVSQNGMNSTTTAAALEKFGDAAEGIPLYLKMAWQAWKKRTKNCRAMPGKSDK